MGIKLITLASATLVLSTSVNAALIDNGTYTTDDVSGLDWLDITETRNMSYNEVSSEFGSGQLFDGWRYANDEEMYNWLSSSGLNAPSSNSFCDALCYYGTVETATVAPADNLISLWGETYNSGGISATLFVFDTAITGIGQLEDYSHLEVELFILASASASNKSIVGHEDIGTSSSKDFGFGHALVRETVVPVPAAVWLFGSGLLGLIGVARRKKA